MSKKCALCGSKETTYSDNGFWLCDYHFDFLPSVISELTIPDLCDEDLNDETAEDRYNN